MKLFAKFTVLLFALVFTFTSCSKDANDNIAQEYNHPEAIVGRWFQLGGESNIKFEANGSYNKMDKSKRPFISSNGEWGQKGKYIYLFQNSNKVDSLEMLSYSQIKDSKGNCYILNKK